MELRKNPKIDLEKKRGMFFNIGLALSLLIVISAFEWKFYDDGALVSLNHVDDDFDEILEIPQTFQPPPPPPPKPIVPVFKEVDDKEIVEDQPEVLFEDFYDDIIIEEIPITPPPAEEDEPFIYVEKMPEPVGGMQAFMTYVAKNIRYPNQARRMRIEGKVFVQFVIDKDGSLTDLFVVKGIGAGCDKEALRVLSSAPKWNPGKQRGIPVKVSMTLPVVYKFQ